MSSLTERTQICAEVSFPGRRPSCPRRCSTPAWRLLQAAMTACRTRCRGRLYDARASRRRRPGSRASCPTGTRACSSCRAHGQARAGLRAVEPRQWLDAAQCACARREECAAHRRRGGQLRRRAQPPRRRIGVVDLMHLPAPWSTISPPTATASRTRRHCSGRSRGGRSRRYRPPLTAAGIAACGPCSLDPRRREPPACVARIDGEARRLGAEEVYPADRRRSCDEPPARSSRWHGAARRPFGRTLVARLQGRMGAPDANACARSGIACADRGGRSALRRISSPTLPDTSALARVARRG